MIASLVFVQALVLVSAQGKTTLDGIYTEAQAARGQTGLRRIRARAATATICLADGQTPALAGKEFNVDWNDLSMSDLFDRTRGHDAGRQAGHADAGAGRPTSSRSCCGRATFPAGQTELPPDAATLKAIKFVSPKP